MENEPKKIIHYLDGPWTEDNFWEDDENEDMEQDQDGS